MLLWIIHRWFSLVLDHFWAVFLIMPLRIRPCLNMWSKFEVKRTCSCVMAICFIDKTSKIEDLKGLCRKKIKKSIFEHSCPQILTKVGTLLHFSKCYAVVELKLKSDILNWTKLSKTATFTTTSVFKLHPQKFTNAKIL